MPEAKTSPTKASVAEHLEAIGDDTRRADCQTQVRLMKEASVHDPVMWGPSIEGFDSDHYRYASGHESDSCLVGFVPVPKKLIAHGVAETRRRYPQRAG